MKFTDFALCCYLFVGISLVPDIKGKKIKDDPSPKTTRITIDVVNEDPASNLCVSCWSTSGNSQQKHHIQQKCFPADNNSVGSISWAFKPNFNKMFWCNARWGLTHLQAFPVFGEGVPRVSSTWLIDGRGKRRFTENGRFVNDFFEDWPGLSMTTKKEDWLFTTEDPITEEPITEITGDPIETTTEDYNWSTTEEIPITEDPITGNPSEPTTTTEADQTTTEEQTTEHSTTEGSTTEEYWTTEEQTTEYSTTQGSTTEADWTTTEEQTTEYSSTSEPTTGNPGEGFVCPLPSGNFPDPLDCTSYYACDAGEVVGHLNCPDGLYFNPAINNCDYPWNVECPLMNR